MFDFASDAWDENRSLCSSSSCCMSCSVSQTMSPALECFCDVHQLFDCPSWKIRLVLALASEEGSWQAKGNNRTESILSVNHIGGGLIFKSPQHTLQYWSVVYYAGGEAKSLLPSIDFLLSAFSRLIFKKRWEASGRQNQDSLQSFERILLRGQHWMGSVTFLIVRTVGAIDSS